MLVSSWYYSHLLSHLFHARVAGHGANLFLERSVAGDDFIGFRRRDKILHLGVPGGSDTKRGRVMEGMNKKWGG